MIPARHGPGDSVEYKMQNYAKSKIQTINIENFLKPRI